MLTAPTAGPTARATTAAAGWGEQAADWQLALSRAFARVTVTVRDRADWSASLATTRLGSLQISDETSGPGTVVRSAASVKADPCRNILARLQLDGTARVLQDDRSVELPPHSLTFLDLSRPFKIILPRRQRARTLMVPRPVVALEENALRRLTATPVNPADGGSGAVLLPLLAETRPERLGESTGVREQVARTVADLLATLAADHAARALPNGQPAARTLFERIISSVETCLGDPDLSPQSIADRHGVSLRHLHQLFQRQGTTVGSWIRSRRLEGARRELARPDATRRAVSAVAARWGFTSPSHFSRAFRDAYGMSPNECRASLCTCCGSRLGGCERDVCGRPRELDAVWRTSDATYAQQPSSQARRASERNRTMGPVEPR